MAWASLSKREREVLAGRYGLSDREPGPWTYWPCGSSSRVRRIRQIQLEALAKLKRNVMRHGVDQDSIF